MSNNPFDKGYKSQLPDSRADVQRQAAAKKARVNSVKLRIGWGNGPLPKGTVLHKALPGSMAMLGGW